MNFFTDPIVAAKYESVFNVDKHVIIPGVYAGLLSNINYAGAYKMVKWGDNQLIEKPAAVVAGGAKKVKATIAHAKRNRSNQ